MQFSAEVRWFREGSDAGAWTEWLGSPQIHGREPFSDAKRTDAYLVDPSTNELGIKRRGEKTGTELKCLISQTDTLPLPSIFRGRVQHWGKWTSENLDLGAQNLVRISKQRVLRKFQIDGDLVSEHAIRVAAPDDLTPTRSGRGAFLELTSISHENGSRWVSIGFESFGSLGELSHNLQQVAEHLFTLAPPTLDGWVCASYPEWLAQR